MPGPMPDRIYLARWWSLCRWGWERYDLRIRGREPVRDRGDDDA